MSLMIILRVKNMIFLVQNVHQDMIGIGLLAEHKSKGISSCCCFLWSVHYFIFMPIIWQNKLLGKIIWQDKLLGKIHMAYQ